MSRTTTIGCDACGKHLANEERDRKGDFITFHFYVVSRFTFAPGEKTLGGEMHSLYSCPRRECADSVQKKVREVLDSDTEEVLKVLLEEVKS